MFAILPGVALAVLFLLVASRSQSIRGAVMIALVLWGVILTAITEILSLFHTLTLPGLVVAWGIVIAGLCMFIYRYRGSITFAGVKSGDEFHAGGRGSASPLQTGRFTWSHIKQSTRSTPISLWITMIGAGVLIALTGMVALIAAPNTWDSMAYHMPRVYFWQQFQNVNPFPAHTNRLLYQPPFAEFIMLHFQIFTGGDGLANIGQWAAMLFSAIGVSKIAKLLGTNAHGQVLAAVLCVTLPIGIMQATGSKNDFVTALWVVCLAYFVISISANPLPTLPRRTLRQRFIQGRAFPADECIAMHPYIGAFFIGASVGLALLTKGTAYVYIAPLLLRWAVMLVKGKPHPLPLPAGEEGSKTPSLTPPRIQRGESPPPLQLEQRVDPADRGSVSEVVAAILLAGIIALLINAGHFARNLSVYGTPLTAPSHSVYYANETFSPAVLVSNTLRNLALHVYIPDQINERVNIGGAIYTLIERVHQAVGIDLNDTRTTFPWNEFEIPPIWQIFNEDRAGNPVHLALFGLAALAYPFLRKTRSSTLTMYLLVGISQFLLFSLLLKWQVWGTRLQLPFFVYITPFIGVVLAAILHRYLNTLLQIGLLFLALFWICNTSTRPIFASTDRNPLALSFYIGNDNINYPSILMQPRLSQYFNAKYELEAPSREVAEEVKTLACDNVGLISDESGILYPLMMLLRADNPAVFMQHVNVDNESAFLSDKAPYDAFAPCAIVFMYGAQPHLPETTDIDGALYRRVWVGEGFEIYVPEQ